MHVYRFTYVYIYIYKYILYYDGKICANLLNTFFGSVFVNDNGNTPVFHSRSNSSTYPNNINFSPERVCSIINKMKSNAAAGPDGLPACFFQKIAPFNICTLKYYFFYHMTLAACQMTGCML